MKTNGFLYKALRLDALLLILLIGAFASQVHAQANPINEKGFHFQGYAVDADKNALTDEDVQVQFSIYEDGNPNSPDFTEIHDLKTDAFGVFSAVVGAINPAQFDNLNWVGKDYFLRAEVKTSGGAFVSVSDTRLLSVPYAQASKVAANGVPAGTILPFAGPLSSIPAGYLACDGASVSKSDFPALFDAISTSWGGDGTNFNLPDLRGQFMRGVAGGTDRDPDASSRHRKYDGGNTGDNVGSYQDESFKEHNHTMNNAGNHNHTYSRTDNVGNGGLGFADDGRDPEGAHRDRSTSSDGAHTHTINNSGGSETRPKNANVNYIIKF